MVEYIPLPDSVVRFAARIVRATRPGEEGCAPVAEKYIRLEIEPVPMLHGGTVDSCGDHRIAMCAAIAATRCTHPVIILGGESVEKSYPQFYEDYNALGGNAHVVVLE